MNKVVMFLLSKIIRQVVESNESVCIDNTKYFLENGVLYKFKYGWDEQPIRIEWFDYGDTYKAINSFVLYLSNIEDTDIETISIERKPTNKITTVWD